MLKYVKICPRCGHKNLESEFNCSKDNHSLIMVEAIRDNDIDSPITVGQPTDGTNPEIKDTNISCPPHEQSLQTEPITKRMGDKKNFTLYLPGTSLEYQVHSGDIIGQEHPTSRAQIQLSGIEGVNVIHRRHCQFELFDGEWFVIPLVQSDFINPTSLNIGHLQPGQRYKITNGDKLTLGRTTFLIRIANE